MRLGRKAQAGERGDLSAVWFASGVSAEMKPPPTLDRKALKALNKRHQSNKAKLLNAARKASK